MAGRIYNSYPLFGFSGCKPGFISAQWQTPWVKSNIDGLHAESAAQLSCTFSAQTGKPNTFPKALPLAERICAFIAAIGWVKFLSNNKGQLFKTKLPIVIEFILAEAPCVPMGTLRTFSLGFYQRNAAMRHKKPPFSFWYIDFLSENDLDAFACYKLAATLIFFS